MINKINGILEGIEVAKKKLELATKEDIDYLEQVEEELYSIEEVLKEIKEEIQHMFWSDDATENN